jgi:hypothetical protein
VPQTPIGPGARFLLEPRLTPGAAGELCAAPPLYVIVWEDGAGSRVEVCAGPDADRMEWLAGSAATFHGVDLVDRRSDTPPPADHSCPWCPAEVRELVNLAHNAAEAQQDAYGGRIDWQRARVKARELAEALDRTEPARQAHFRAVSTEPADAAATSSTLPVADGVCPRCGSRLQPQDAPKLDGLETWRCQGCRELAFTRRGKLVG